MIVSSENELYKKFLQQNKQAPKKPKKNDILSKYPLRLLAYSNEVGAAISPINNTLGTVLWAPALLYLGADIYDKYKNEENTYNPSTERSVRQAIFQGLASVILPTGAIKLGQTIGVKFTKDESALSALEKKEIVEFTRNYLDNSEYPKADNLSFTDGLLASFKESALRKKVQIENKTVVSKAFSLFKEGNEQEVVFEKYLKDPNKDNPVLKYLTKQGELCSSILSGEPFQNRKYSKFFAKSTKKFNNQGIARKETLLKLLKDKNIDKSIVATISGFIALILLAKPIDYFVENVLMHKIVNPLLDGFFTHKNEIKQEHLNKKA